jgi:hypothetical protein
MPDQILVPLKSGDRIEEIIPYLEEIAKPGMRVVFFIPYPVEKCWLQDHWITTESPTRAMKEGRNIVEKYSWHLQEALADQKILIARKALRDKGLEIVVNIYTGSVRSVVESYTANRDVCWMMVRAAHSYPLLKFLRRMMPLSGFIKRSHTPPVLLFRPQVN